MKIINWFGLYPVEQIKKFYKKKIKVEKTSMSTKTNNNGDSYSFSDNCKNKKNIESKDDN
tara:strand:- start:408 stop:587 length:180 start_codon:yes stop_codon:yes gene_type:complete